MMYRDIICIIAYDGKELFITTYYNLFFYNLFLQIIIYVQSTQYTLSLKESLFSLKFTGNFLGFCDFSARLGDKL